MAVVMTPKNNMTDNNKRKRGGQPGNINSLKHGFNSKLFKPLKVKDLEAFQSTDLKDEIAMLRVATRRAFKLANDADDINQMIKALGALGLASIRTSRLLKAQKELGNGDKALDAISTAINEVLEEWGWRDK
jgi:hypothetical protein